MEVTESSTLLLPFTASSVGVARRHLVSDLIEAGVCAPAVTDAALVISELLSNALRHGGPLPGSGIRVGWDLDADSVRVAVSDGGGSTRPELGQPTPTTTGGAGGRSATAKAPRYGRRSWSCRWRRWRCRPPRRKAAEPTGFAQGQVTLSLRST